MTDVQARYNPGQRRDDNGMWTDDGIPNRRNRGGASSPSPSNGRQRPPADRLNLTGRIGLAPSGDDEDATGPPALDLADDEHVVASDRMRSSNGSYDVNHAVIEGPLGRELWLDTSTVVGERWDPRGDGTGRLDAEQVRELHSQVTEAARQAAETARRVNAAFRESDEAGWAAFEQNEIVASGLVGDEFGSVGWDTSLVDGEPTSWTLTLYTSAGRVQLDANPEGVSLPPGEVRRLLRLLDGLPLGEVNATMATTRVARTGSPALDTIPNVELARTGSWALSSGQWNPKPEDFAAAVAALNCPAVRAARIRLGHVDPRFDGEPAVGSVTNLRTENGGHSLVGDLSQVPGWLPNVINAAYPDRSVEGVYGHVCQVGHTHPFVLTGLALLGVTAPGVGTLRSIDDVGAMYGMTGQAVAATFQGEVSAAQDREQLKRFWTKSPEGLAKWAKNAHPWTALYRHLKKHMPDELAKRTASEWYHDVFGQWPGSRKGKNKNGPG